MENKVVFFFIEGLYDGGSILRRSLLVYKLLFCELEKMFFLDEVILKEDLVVFRKERFGLGLEKEMMFELGYDGFRLG